MKGRTTTKHTSSTIAVFLLISMLVPLHADDGTVDFRQLTGVPPGADSLAKSI